MGIASREGNTINERFIERCSQEFQDLQIRLERRLEDSDGAAGERYMGLLLPAIEEQKHDLRAAVWQLERISV